MQIDVKLIRSDMTPNDTFYFSDKESQDRYFQNITTPSKFYSNISFTGSRKIRINDNSIYLNLNGYNYAILYYDNPTGGEKLKYYCFIDEFTWLNDTACELSLTLDYIQTYMFSVKLAKGFTIKQSTIYSAMPSDYYKSRNVGNLLPIVNYKYNILYEPANPPDICFAIYTVKSSYYKTELSRINTEFDYNLSSGLISFIVPLRRRNIVGLGESGYEVLNIYRPDGSLLVNNLAFTENTDQLPPNFVGVSVCDDIFANWYTGSVSNLPLGSFTYSGKKLYFNPANTTSSIQYYSPTGEDESIATPLFFGKSPKRHLIIEANGESKFIPSIPTRMPYTFIQISQYGMQKQIISLDDIEQENSTSDFISPIIDLLFNPLFPNDIFGMYNSRDYTGQFSIKAKATSLALELTAWSDFYSSNQASVNDGLATKHAYDVEIANRNMAGNLLSSSVGAVGSVIEKDYTGAVVGATQSLIGSAVAYTNIMSNVELENKLLQIHYNDIKSSPSMIYNATSNQNSMGVINTGRLKILQAIPCENEQKVLFKYHNQYGFALDLPTTEEYTIAEFIGLQSLNNGGNVHAYVNLSGVSIKGNVPIAVKNTISKIFANGIHFWYPTQIFNYPKYSVFDTKYKPLILSARVVT